MEVFLLLFFVYCGYLIVKFFVSIHDGFTESNDKSTSVSISKQNKRTNIITVSKYMEREYFKNTPKEISSMNWREFEFFIASLFREKGYKTTVTPAEKDGGKDVVAEKDGVTYFIECKHWQHDGVIGRELLQKLVGAAIGHGVNHAIFIATCQYNSNAKEYAIQARNNGFDIQLWGIDDIFNFCPSYPSIFLYSETQKENFYVKKPIATLKNTAAININKDIDTLIATPMKSAANSSWSYFSFYAFTTFENLSIVTIKVSQTLIIKNNERIHETNSSYKITYDKHTGARKELQSINNSTSK